MAHLAKIQNGIVVQVIPASQDAIDAGVFGSEWVQTSYNTLGGQHLLGGTPLRKNYAGIGYSYDSERDAFIPPKPYASWVLDEATCLWNAPVAMPSIIQTTEFETGTSYVWNEETTSWDEVIVPTLTTV
jgi:hypothetical protein